MGIADWPGFRQPQVITGRKKAFWRVVALLYSAFLVVFALPIVLVIVISWGVLAWFMTMITGDSYVVLSSDHPAWFASQSLKWIETNIQFALFGYGHDPPVGGESRIMWVPRYWGDS